MSTQTSKPIPFGVIVFRLRVEDLKKILEQIRTEYVQIYYDVERQDYTIHEEILS